MHEIRSLSKFLSHWIRYSQSLELTVPYKQKEQALSPQGRSREKRGARQDKPSFTALLFASY
jgi:hypothetical protein